MWWMADIINGKSVCETAVHDNMVLVCKCSNTAGKRSDPVRKYAIVDLHYIISHYIHISFRKSKIDVVLAHN